MMSDRYNIRINKIYKNIYCLNSLQVAPFLVWAQIEEQTDEEQRVAVKH